MENYSQSSQFWQRNLVPTRQGTVGTLKIHIFAKSVLKIYFYLVFFTVFEFHDDFQYPPNQLIGKWKHDFKASTCSFSVIILRQRIFLSKQISECVCTDLGGQTFTREGWVLPIISTWNTPSRVLPLLQSEGCLKHIIIIISTASGALVVGGVSDIYI